MTVRNRHIPELSISGPTFSTKRERDQWDSLVIAVKEDIKKEASVKTEKKPLKRRARRK